MSINSLYILISWSKVPDQADKDVRIPRVDTLDTQLAVNMEPWSVKYNMFHESKPQDASPLCYLDGSPEEPLQWHLKQDA